MSINENKEFTQIAKALSDKARTAMIAEIAKRGIISCSDLIDFVKLSQPTVSHHLNILERAELIIVEKNGKFLSISLNKERLGEFAGLLNNLAALK